MPTKTAGKTRIENFIEAISHPVRHKALVILHGREASPKEIADLLGEPTPNVSHHVKRLVELDCAELVRNEPVRGSTIRHVYKATERVLIDDDDWNRLVEDNPPFARHYLCSCINEQIDDFRRAVAAGTLGSDDQWCVSRTPVVLDEEGLREAFALARKAEDDLAAIVQRSAARRREDGTDAIPVSVDLNVFKSVPR